MRNPDNTKIWINASVRVAFGLTRPDLPLTIDDDWDETDWPEVGILDGEDGFGEERSSNETKHYGWGIGLIRIGTSQFELARTFSPLENNAVTKQIIFPGSTATKVKMPKPVHAWLAFETDSDLDDKERLFTTRRSRLWVPANNRNETDITKWEVNANVFADGADDVFDRQALEAA
ncbi:hypothetical protein [Rhodococcoides fascians]|uniref:hypothetical protein n=1 Tax=Rhodococcoides fascians TaxID=1828 RepID=UPI000691F943|nr:MULTISPECIES: hypothetical protein [Rhodococcus]OZC50519.1 hypothetical protein CH289_15955 [Rhodococcus sp. RS1C4]OZD65150.1 hypothetical protein CH263_13485 [Rhodococcus sp. 06-1059B-a]OZE98081.1 hypothetical protein CH301_17200 [Rhodococcus sp. 15-1189-1-1a]OZF12731.1 hypothetical protein CH299_17885 [Rhodococcus sp. 14-2686-1-2]